MNVQVVYCNYHSADLSVRERLAFADGDLPRAYDMLRDRFPKAEFVVLSTCNRVELYGAQEDPHEIPSHRDLAQFFADFHQVPLGDFMAELLEQTGPDAVRHLFQVAASLDSMVLGEPQIVAQVKQAYASSQEHAAAGPLTNALFQRSLSVAKRVRSETQLAEGRVSIASVAVSGFAQAVFDRFDDKTVLVIGAGEMAGETLRYLQAAGARKILVSNRNPQRAEQIAAQFAAEPRPYEQLDQWLAEADVIISTTGSSEPIVDVPRFSRVRKATGEKPVFILDLGAPRDFHPEVGRIDENVFLYDIDDLEATCQRNRKSRSKEVERALLIVEQETETFMRELYHRATGPIISRLRDQWSEVTRLELERLFSRLPQLGPQDRQTIQRSIERLVNKLLHPPLEALRDEAREGTPHGLMNALKRLFGLGEPRS